MAEGGGAGTGFFSCQYVDGYSTSTKKSGSEFLIEVTFENDKKKRFFPKYQEKSLMIIKDE